MKKYCPDCSRPMEYSVSPPNFCPNCGHKFSAFGLEQKQEDKSAPVKKRPVEPKTVNQDAFGIEEGGSSGNSSIPNIRELEFEITTAKKQSLKQVMGGRLTQPNEFGPRDSEPKLSEDEFLKQYSQEGGSNPRRTP